MKKYLLIFSISFSLVFWGSVSAADAAINVTNDYSGCFARTQTETGALVWLTAPLCTITVKNDTVFNQWYTFTVENLDPAWYQAEDSLGNSVPATRSLSDLIFSVKLLGYEEKTITVSPWDYNPDVNDFWFSAISDTQTAPGSDTPNEVFVTIMDELQTIRTPFTTVSGDIIGGTAGSQADAKQEQQDEYELYDEVYNAYEGSSFMVPGNHDARQNIEDYYSAFYGDSEFTFVYGNTRFIGFFTPENNNQEGTVPAATLSWLTDVLSSAQEENIIVMMHHPLVAAPWADGTTIAANQQLTLGNLFVQYGVDLVLVGHQHGYDDHVITSQDIPGLNGSVWQLIIGGAGGNITNYEGDHFFVLLHIENNLISAEKFDYSPFDLSVNYEGVNDGTESESHFTIFNNSDLEIPYMRAKVNLNTSEKVYARTAANEFIPFVSAKIDNVLRGYTQLSLAPQEILEITVKEYHQLLTETVNLVDNTGVVAFPVLPKNTAQESDIAAVPSTQATITISQWDMPFQKRKWTEIASAGDSATYTLSSLNRLRQYQVFLNGKFKGKLNPDLNNSATFTAQAKKARRDYRVIAIPTRVAQYVGAMPASAGGANLSLFDQDHDKINAFFAYDKSLNHGFDSWWIDLDGDNELDLVTVPTAGKHSQISAFTTDGASLASIYPFGKDFKGGVSLAATDLDNDNKQELIVAPKSAYVAVVKVYSYRANTRQFKLIDQIRVWDTAYNQGLNLASGNFDNKKGEEVAVSAIAENKEVLIYQWLPKKRTLAKWMNFTSFSNDQEINGVSLAMGDLNDDGTEELALGAQNNGRTLEIYKYQTGKTQPELINRRAVFGNDYQGGFDLAVGNLNQNPREEIVVIPHTPQTASGKILVLKLKNIKQINKIAFKRPFGKNASSFNLALADLNGDWQQEIIVARNTGKSEVRIYQQPEPAKLTLFDSYLVYPEDFTGGLILTK